MLKAAADALMEDAARRRRDAVPQLFISYEDLPGAPGAGSGARLARRSRTPFCVRVGARGTAGMAAYRCCRPARAAGVKMWA